MVVVVERRGPTLVILEEETVGLAEDWVNSDPGFSKW